MNQAPPRHRLFVTASLAAGLSLSVSDGQAHYLHHVLRMQPGDSIVLFNGQDGEWQAHLTEVSKKRVSAVLDLCLRTQPPERDLWLIFAAVKRGPMDMIVEKATELGVSVLQPVFTERTVMSRVGEDRLRLIAIEASEQCERLSVPEVRPPVTLSAVLTDWPAERPLILLDETGGGRPIAEILMQKRPRLAAFLIGPEGGFTKSELDAVRAFPFSTGVGLGRRVLRADTAAIAALSCYQALCGDWMSDTLQS